MENQQRQNVLFEKRDGVGTLTLNQPENRNALSFALTEEFVRVIQEVKKDPEIRALVITGSGKSFCSGGDVREMAAQHAMPAPERMKIIKGFYEKLLTFLELDIPVVASINGHAIGAGASLTAACDLRIASEEAKIGFGFVRVGLHPGLGATYFLPRLVGTAKAMELIFTGEPVDAKESLRIGLVNKVVPKDMLQEETFSFVKKFADGPPIPIRMVKQALSRELYTTLESALEYEAFAQTVVSQTEDVMEGVMSFLEKRAPKFNGK